MKSTTEIIQDLIEEVKERKGLLTIYTDRNKANDVEAMAIIDVRWLGEELIKRTDKTGSVEK